MTNIFNEVYAYAGARKKYRSLYNALNREDVQSVIVHNGHWWTEQHSHSRGLSEAQYRALDEVVNLIRGAHERLT